MKISNELGPTPLVVSSESTLDPSFLQHISLQEFENLDILAWWKENEISDSRRYHS